MAARGLFSEKRVMKKIRSRSKQPLLKLMTTILPDNKSHKRTFPNELMTVKIPIWSFEDCKKIYNIYKNGVYSGRITDGNICAGSSGKDSCNGDSGGGLICYDIFKRPYLAGIVSWGDTQCGHHDLPGVYSRILYYKKWIKANLVGDNPVPNFGRKRFIGNGNSRVLPISFLVILICTIFRMQ